MNLEKFFFTVASFGPELKEWSNRAKLLEEWRRVADSVRFRFALNLMIMQII